MRRATIALALGAALLLPAQSGAVNRPPGPALSISAATANAALRCTGPLRSTRRRPLGRPVLLVHGTMSNAAESWGWNYMNALPEFGHPACAIDLPDRAMVDIQLSSEYVVQAIRLMAARAHRAIDVLGHSQGGLEPLWALKWWPDLRRLVTHYVGIGTGGHGLAYLTPVCALLHACPPAFWQLSDGSNFFGALRAGGMTPGPTQYTSILSLTDEIAGPNIGPDPVGVIPGADNIVVQNLCPGRVVDHIGELYDAAVFALVRYALDHAGPVDLAAVGHSACGALLMPGVDPRTFAFELAKAVAGIAEGLVGSPFVNAEPPLAAYAQ
jgi:hypothetical protein